MSKMESMDTPQNRSEFEQNFHLLKEKIQNDKMHFNPGMGLGLTKVRLLPNGRIDFLSVNESARLHANTMAHFDSSRMKELMKQQEGESEK